MFLPIQCVSPYPNPPWRLLRFSFITSFQHFDYDVPVFSFCAFFFPLGVWWAWICGFVGFLSNLEIFQLLFLTVFLVPTRAFSPTPCPLHICQAAWYCPTADWCSVFIISGGFCCYVFKFVIFSSAASDLLVPLHIFFHFIIGICIFPSPRSVWVFMSSVSFLIVCFPLLSWARAGYL